MYKRNRGFNVAKGFEEQGIELPIQSTKTSAGFDFEAAEDTTIEPIWKAILNFKEYLFSKEKVKAADSIALNILLRPTLVPTGIKAYMGEDEFLGLFNRSSNPMKKLLIMTNGVGVVDSDYYENPDNDGHIMFQFINFGLFPVTIKKGEKVGQGIFQPYLKADEGKARVLGEERAGGFGSTDKPEPLYEVGEEVSLHNHSYRLPYNIGVIINVDTSGKLPLYNIRPTMYYGDGPETLPFTEEMILGSVE